MSSSVVADLVEALRSAPQLDSLVRALLAAARQTGDVTPALDYLAATDPTVLTSTETRLSAGELLLEHGRPGAALAWYPEGEPQFEVRRTRALLALGRRSDAAELYRRAVKQDETVRAADLDQEFALLKTGTGGADVIELRSRRSGLAPKPIDTASTTPLRERITFSDIGGLNEVKDQIRRKIILPFQKPSLFQRFRRRAGGGILMFGPPGCGKTMLARATAGECRAAFHVIRIPEILDMWIGESEKRLARAFEEARASRPAVLFFDEIEAIAARRRFDAAQGQASLVSTFLSELDGVGADNEGILVLAATNVPWAIDSAFRRPGRFDRVIFVTPPDREARIEILRAHLKDRPQAGNLDLRAIAGKTPGFSGADLSGLVEAAADLAIDESFASSDGTVVPIGQQHLVATLREQKATTVEWLTTARNYAKYANEGGLYDDVIAFLDKHTR